MCMNLIAKGPSVMVHAREKQEFLSKIGSGWLFWNKENVFPELHLAIIICTKDIFAHTTI